MHDRPALILTALLILLFGLISKKAEHSIVSAPMVFVAIGVLVSPLGLDLFQAQFHGEAVKGIAEITLLMILFIDASFIKFSHLKQRLAGVPARLLLVGLPLTMILGTVVGYFIFPAVNIWYLVILALILSPTDAALGQAVVKSDAVPEKIRDSISIESGLNDGIALPLILVCIAILGSGDFTLSTDDKWLRYLALQLTLGPLFGAVVGIVGGRLVEWASAKDWMEPTFQRLASFSLALLAYACAELFHGNGFIAAFVAGLTLGVKSPMVRLRLQEFGEAEGQLLSLFIFLILGLVAVPFAYQFWTREIVIYALLSLTLIRMLPVMLCLLGTGLPFYSKIFIAWFGPRGIASFLYLLIMVSDLGIKGYEQVLATIILTVLMSVFAHGISAVAMSDKFKKTL
ncbi:cation:proton antiporter [Thalassotalea sp. ND16A]|uniref:cation:proton antiporter n=1 Tax=Thalassotalea sp. ND16A TaxID=1535422 RepID=UPI00051A0005|nr:cation:proton antiporter [Thalassotalea sp. ND16A]KGJ98404.1 hypothetical protein ND16A_0713 [Thalassotalea sp. ND16A]